MRHFIRCERKTALSFCGLDFAEALLNTAKSPVKAEDIEAYEANIMATSSGTRGARQDVGVPELSVKPKP